MQTHDLAESDALAHLTSVAQRALARYDVSAHSTVALLDQSENATFRVDDPVTGRSSILRVHRLAYHSSESIASELAWIDALREHAGIRTPHVISTRGGQRTVTIKLDGVPARTCVMFELLPGTEPPESRLVQNFEALGQITARMHRHSREWRLPVGFTRFRWDCDTAFGPQARWGRWQDGVAVGPAERAILDRLEATLRRRLAAYGMGPERFGLVHADLRLANLLVDDAGSVSVIDFDDCGFSWFLYDLGTAVSFFEHHPRVPELLDSWLRGYRSVLGLPQADQDEIWTFIMFRRLLLVAWIGSHPTVPIARDLGASYTAGSCELAEHYLSRLS